MQLIHFFLLPLVSTVLAGSLITCPCNIQDCGDNVEDDCACENQNKVIKYFCCDGNDVAPPDFGLKNCDSTEKNTPKPVGFDVRVRFPLCGGNHMCPGLQDVCYPLAEGSDRRLSAWGVCAPGDGETPWEGVSNMTAEEASRLAAAAAAALLMAPAPSASPSGSSSSETLEAREAFWPFPPLEETSTTVVSTTVAPSSASDSGSSSSVPVSTSVVVETSTVPASSSSSVPVFTTLVVETSTVPASSSSSSSSSSSVVTVTSTVSKPLSSSTLVTETKVVTSSVNATAVATNTTTVTSTSVVKSSKPTPSTLVVESATTDVVVLTTITTTVGAKTTTPSTLVTETAVITATATTTTTGAKTTTPSTLVTQTAVITATATASATTTSSSPSSSSLHFPWLWEWVAQHLDGGHNHDDGAAVAARALATSKATLSPPYDDRDGKGCQLTGDCGPDSYCDWEVGCPAPDKGAWEKFYHRSCLGTCFLNHHG